MRNFLSICECFLSALSEPLPVIVASFEHIGPMGIAYNIQNVGNSTGINVEIKVELEPAKFHQDLKFPVLTPYESVSFLFPESGILKVKENEVFSIRGSCVNILGESVEINHEILIGEVLSTWIDGKRRIRDSQTTVMKKMEDSMSRIERSINRMLAWGGGILIKTEEEITRSLKELEERDRKIG